MNPNFMFNLFPVFFFLIFGLIIFQMIRGVGQWHKNNQQPVLTVDAKIVSKRHHTSRSSSNHNGHMHSSTHRSYYVTFEFESGDRLELKITGGEYGLLAEGDKGRLTFQGTRYHKFDRHRG